MSEFLTGIRGSLSDIVGLIDAELAAAPPPPPPAPPPAPPPEPLPPVYVTIPACYQLFGPTQANGALTQTPTSVFDFQGNALTASTKQIYLGANVADVDVARAVAVWAPGSAANEIEIVKFDNGPTNIERIGLIVGQNLSTPTASGVIITAALQAMVDSARANGTPYKHIGFRMKGPASYTLYEVRVEVSWKFPT